MSAVLAILRREVQAYLVSPGAYVFIVVFLTVVGLGFLFGLQVYSRIPPDFAEKSGVTVRTALVSGPSGFVSWAYVAMLASLPGLSMRLFSEERKSGTIELLFTSPLTTAQLVAGKFLGAIVVFLAILALTLPLVGILAWKAEPEWAALGAAYAGLLLVGAVVLAIGLFASTLTETQFVALVVTYAILAPLLGLQLVVGFLGNPWDEILAGVSLEPGMRQLALGLVDSHYVVFYVVLASGFLFLSARVLDSGRWR